MEVAMNQPKGHTLLAAIATVIIVSVGSPASVEASDPKPFDGTFDGELTFFAPFSPGSSPTCNANFSGDPSAPGAVVTVVDSANGRFSGMGVVTLESTTCVDPNSPYSQGHGVIIASNGDRVFIDFDNLAAPDPDNPGGLILTGGQWVTGGTGRFEGATGTQTCSITLSFTSPTTGVVQGTCTGTIQVDEDAQGEKSVARLEQNHPNPFNPHTEIRYSITAPGRVRLDVYDVNGRLIRRLVDHVQSAGEHRVAWTGTDDRGRPVASGVYFYRLTLNGYQETRKLVVDR
jgi:hypothetical protein